MRLWYEQPAKIWEEAIPIGNGRLGGMVFSGTLTDEILLNEDTLWAGFPRDTVNYEARRHLARARELVFAGKHADAQKWIEERMVGKDCEPYLPLGRLSIARIGDAEEAVSGYRRELDLAEGIASFSYRVGETTVRGRYFASEPDQVLVVRYEAEGGTLDADVTLGTLLKTEALRADREVLTLVGRAPSHVSDNYDGDHPEAVLYEDGLGLPFVAHLKVDTDGTAKAGLGRIEIRGATSFSVYLSAETGFAGYASPPEEEEFLARSVKRTAEAAAQGYAGLEERHAADHRALFGRMSFSLGDEGAKRDDVPTDERLETYQRTRDDLGLEALYFQYGRYLLMASSRPGTQPANLQGIWNAHVQPPWNSDYTVNINTQMNYWLAETCNLSECHDPLFAMLEELSEAGARTARIHYGCRGWTAHHNIDVWRMTTPTSGKASWAFWPMGGAWLATHLWERYLFDGDIGFLRDRALPILKGAALFCLDWLTEGPDGRLVTNPSTSPENSFYTADCEVACVSQGSTMDIAISRELFRICLASLDAVGGGEEEAFRAELTVALETLPDYRIGRYGQLQEWLEDYAEPEPGHRHLSHLFGLYPGNQIHEGTPELLAAAAVSLERRLAGGGGHTGWSCAWLINLFARLKDGAHAYEQVQALLAKSTYPNLFDAHPPFQIDGNFGGTAGIAELLLQSHRDGIELLPALPAQWREGAIEGLRARGGFEIDIQWKEGRLEEAFVTACRDGICRIRYAEALEVADESGAKAPIEKGTFVAAAGIRYRIAAVRAFS